MPPPTRMPIGLRLSRTARSTSRAFDAALTAAGGSLPVWLVLISLKSRPTANQRQIADVVGIRGATLTHHLNGMERDGLIVRRLDPNNRRMHVVELTEAGEQTFRRLRAAATDFDRRLRSGLNEADLATLERLLTQLDENVQDASDKGSHTDD
ncbi:MAG TPA: MarR family winged helix-turn-helix transcriptional regulator [Mycobacteriales bacterium]|nr:MarR family winged helix-turn-helix transcriptional regulator [Mycobacteriales bacterium]